MKEMSYKDTRGRVFEYGDFFPYDLSPFAYNETVAQEYFPLAKEQAKERGFFWYEPDDRNYNVTVRNEDISDADLDGSALKKIFECKNKGSQLSQCTGAFRVIPQELSLYQQLGVPLPRYCYNCRHYNRLQQRNPMKLWHRRCMCTGKHGKNTKEQIVYQNTTKHFHGEDSCPNEFETSYAPEKPEIVYCEKCYQTEIY